MRAEREVIVKRRLAFIHWLTIGDRMNVCIRLPLHVVPIDKSDSELKGRVGSPNKLAFVKSEVCELPHDTRQTTFADTYDRDIRRFNQGNPNRRTTTPLIQPCVEHHCG